jgi:hypothetical protein
MRKLLRVLELIASAASILTSAPRAGALEPCGTMECREESRCQIVTEPCGTNPDGTTFFCSHLECQDVTVCKPVTPCLGEPLPEILPDFPDLPDLPELPGFPPSPLPRPSF